ncbi:MAG: class I SAM-dependent methyltransferase [Bacteroidales bacterium]|nr:class I SAM-dependent methyltransferase [Bacteroidales bacterium]
MFDEVAGKYDQSFTHSLIGSLQRKQVHAYLDKIIKPGAMGTVLELNAGTGEDALYFARKGWQVLATDISPEMVKEGKRKAGKANLQDLIEFKVADVRDLGKLNLQPKFDLVFSDFGGLNCINQKELCDVSAQLASLLKPGGRFIAVVMPRICLWENAYFIFKFDFKSAFRRNTDQVVKVPVGDKLVDTWYYSPSGFASYFKMFFRNKAMKPIGISVPPSYMEPFFAKHPKLLHFFGTIENLLNKAPAMAGYSDHFLIDFELKSGL